MDDPSDRASDETLAPITRWLHSASQGDRAAQDRLYREIYPVLYRIAAAKSGVRSNSTITPTLVINELYLKLSSGSALDSQNRLHFYATCSRAMRFIVTDLLRAALSQKRGGDLEQTALTQALLQQPDRAQELLDITAALEDLETIDPYLRELVELKFFGGLGYSEIGELHGRSERSVKRDWVRARALLVAHAASTRQNEHTPGA